MNNMRGDIDDCFIGQRVKLAFLHASVFNTDKDNFLSVDLHARRNR